MISVSNGADLVKRTRISSLEEFQRKIQDKSLGFNGFENSTFSETMKKPSSLSAAVQIGGSGIQVGITGLKPENEVSIFELPQFKKAKEDEAFDLQIQKGKDNYENFQVLAQIIEFVGNYAKEINQENFDVDIGVAGFDAHNPPSNMGEETKKKAKLAKEGEYSLANVPLYADDGRGITNFFNPTLLFTEKLRNSTGGFSLKSEQGLIASNRFRVNGSILNDTVTLACSHTEGLQKGDSSVGVVCGTGFNMGIAKGFNGVGFDDLKDANLELGHWPVAANATYLNPFDIPFVKDGRLLSQEERDELVKTKSPEVLFSGSNPAEARSIKNILINMKDLLQLNDEAIKQSPEAIGALKKHLGVDDVPGDINKAIKEARQVITNLEKNKTLDAYEDKDIEDLAVTKESAPSKFNTWLLISDLYFDYFQRLGNLIGQTLKGQGVDSPKAINFTGSYFVKPFEKLGKDAESSFYAGLAKGLERSFDDIQYNKQTNQGIKINLTSREEMDGMVTMIKTKANAESKRRIEALAAMNRAAVGT